VTNREAPWPVDSWPKRSSVAASTRDGKGLNVERPTKDDNILETRQATRVCIFSQGSFENERSEEPSTRFPFHDFFLNGVGGAQCIGLGVTSCTRNRCRALSVEGNWKGATFATLPLSLAVSSPFVGRPHESAKLCSSANTCSSAIDSWPPVLLKGPLSRAAAAAASSASTFALAGNAWISCRNTVLFGCRFL